jgi:hypothetical protein
MPVALGAQLPVRLEDDVDKRLEKIATNAGTSKSALIRLLAKTFVEQVVQPDGSVNLPPNWRELLKPADGRSTLPKDRIQDAGDVKIVIEDSDKKTQTRYDIDRKSTRPDPIHDQPVDGANSTVGSSLKRGGDDDVEKARREAQERARKRKAGDSSGGKSSRGRGGRPG